MVTKYFKKYCAESQLVFLNKKSQKYGWWTPREELIIQWTRVVYDNLLMAGVIRGWRDVNRSVASWPPLTGAPYLRTSWTLAEILKLKSLEKKYLVSGNPECKILKNYCFPFIKHFLKLKPWFRISFKNVFTFQST